LENLLLIWIGWGTLVTETISLKIAFKSLLAVEFGN
jgi:hypothetical protein